MLRVGSGATDQSMREDIRSVLLETFLFSGVTESDRGATPLITVTVGGSFGELCLAREVERGPTAPRG